MDIIEKIRSGKQLTAEEQEMVLLKLPEELQKLRQDDPTRYRDLLRALVVFIDELKSTKGT